MTNCQVNGISSYIPEFEGEVRETWIWICVARLSMGRNMRAAQGRRVPVGTVFCCYRYMILL